MSKSPLNLHFEELKKLSSKANSHKDILEISNKIKKFSSGHGYSSQQPYIKSLFLLSAAAVALTFLFANVDALNYLFNVDFQIYSVASCVIFASVFLHREGTKSIITDNVAIKAVEIKNELKHLTFDGYELWLELRKKFPLFNCGDESQRISQLMSGTTEEGVDFNVFEFTYVTVREVEEKDSDGQKTTKEERTTHEESGILAVVEGFNGFTINTNRYDIKWSSSSKKFNDRFKIKCANELTAAKFFTPSMVLTFEDNYVDLLSMDVSDGASICMQFDRKILPSTVNVKSIKNTDEYVKQLENPPELLVLTQAKEVIDIINSKTNNKLKRAV